MNEPSLFGTDGIRGPANKPPLVPGDLVRLGSILGWLPVEFPGAFTYPMGQDDPGGLGEGLYEADRPRVVLARDPRRSGEMISSALISGLTASGADVFQCGQLPTPAVSVLTDQFEAHLGISISASHNPPTDNGVKLFAPKGFKFSSYLEEKIDSLYRDDKPYPPVPVNGDRLGEIQNCRDEARERYLDFLSSKFSSSLDSIEVVVDPAYGAATELISPLFRDRLNVKSLHLLSEEPDGTKINQGCGTANLEPLREAVLEYGADLGIALDGDADRALVVDQKGKKHDGDDLLACFATEMKQNDELSGNSVIGTVMANQGLARFLEKEGIEFVRVSVGDQNILRKLYDDQLSLGGEQSGHIINFDQLPTGDGLLTALNLLSVMVNREAPASELLNRFEPFPQVLENVDVSEKPPLDSIDQLQKSIDQWNDTLKPDGRVLVRYSGTEPVCRIMVEGPDQDQISEAAEDIASVVRETIS